MKKCEEKRGNLLIVCESECYFNKKMLVSVFSSCGELVCDGTTDKSGRCRFDIKTDDNYKIRIDTPFGLSPSSAYRWIFVNHTNRYTLYFKFLPLWRTPDTVKVAFRLTDANYENLPINQGVISLWHNIT